LNTRFTRRYGEFVNSEISNDCSVPEFDVKTLQAYDDMKRRVYRNCHVGRWLKELESNGAVPVDLFWDLCGDSGTAIENCILEILESKKMHYNGIRFGKPLKEKNRSAQTATYDATIFFDSPNDLQNFQASCNIQGKCDVENTLDFLKRRAGYTKGEIKSSKLKDKGKHTCLDLKQIFLERFSLLIAAFRMKGMIRVFIMNKTVFESKPDLLSSNGKKGGLRLLLASTFSLDEREKAEKDILKQLGLLSYPWFNICF
jgi:hypothetical protein